MNPLSAVCVRSFMSGALFLGMLLGVCGVYAHATEEKLSFGRFGTVTVYRPSETPS